MFNQQNYINEYIKNNYKTIKLRIKNTDEVLLNKISSVQNINQYITNLIRKDIENSTYYNFINKDIIIDFDLSPSLNDLINRAEKADLRGDYGLYMNIVYAIDSQAKKEAANHTITESNWNKLLRRYQL